MQNRLIFTTLFNSYYLCKGLVMYESLKCVCDDFHLYVFAYDEKSYAYLKLQNYENVTVISLDELEHYFPKLLDVKSQRTFAEYCWTTTAFTIKYCLDNFDIDHCTYIDSDLYFSSNPRVLVDELGQNDIIITEHNYTPRYDQSTTSGKYCVQFVLTRNNTNGRCTIDWWKDACYDWCYNRYEDGKFGDQKYLDDWTTRFRNVHVLRHLGVVAPWNIQQFSLRNQENKVVLYHKNTKKEYQLIFYHFHYFHHYKIFNLYEYIFGPYELSSCVINMVYRPYLNAISKIHKLLNKNGFTDGDLGYFDIELPIWRKGIHLLRTIFRRNKKIRAN